MCGYQTGKTAVLRYHWRMDLQTYLIDIGYFINFTLIPFLFALALFFFIFNAARYFIIGAGDAAKRESARRLALYGIGAFVILVSLWGVVNLLAYSLNIDYDRSICPDYMDGWCGDSGDNANSRGFFFEFEYEGNTDNRNGWPDVGEDVIVPIDRPERPWTTPFSGPQ